MASGNVEYLRCAMNSNQITVRDIEVRDLSDVVRIHLSAFPEFLMSLLGPRFLRTYYEVVLDYPERIFIAAISPEGRVYGFVSGFAQPQGFYRLFGARKKKAMASALLHVARRPSIWKRVLANMREVQSRAADYKYRASVVELASIAVDPITIRHGYGKQLALAFLERARLYMADYVVLTTDALSNDAVNTFYKQLGFQCSSTFERTGGRLMNQYIYEIKQ